MWFFYRQIWKILVCVGEHSLRGKSVTKLGRNICPRKMSVLNGHILVVANPDIAVAVVADFKAYLIKLPLISFIMMPLGIALQFNKKVRPGFIFNHTVNACS